MVIASGMILLRGCDSGQRRAAEVGDVASQ